MSFALNHAKDAIDVMDLRERLDLLHYLTPKLVLDAGTVKSSSEAGDIGNAPTAMQVLTEMRNSREKFRSVREDAEGNWARLKELGHEIDRQRTNDQSLMEILSEMRG